jgi:hypothetical protein
MLGIKDDDYVTVTLWKTDLSRPSEKVKYVALAHISLIACGESQRRRASLRSDAKGCGWPQHTMLPQFDRFKRSPALAYVQGILSPGPHFSNSKLRDALLIPLLDFFAINVNITLFAA